MKAICEAVRAIVREFDDIEFMIPVHPSPAIRRTFAELQDCERVSLMPPLAYPEFVMELAQSYLVLTDSGGIQEEATYLKKPVLVLREATDRPESMELGMARLAGTTAKDIVRHVRLLVRDAGKYSSMIRDAAPFGDGFASRRIAAELSGATVGQSELAQ